MKWPISPTCRAYPIALLSCLSAVWLTAAAPATAPATQRTATDDPFITQEAPPSNRPAVAASELVRFSLTEGFIIVHTKLSPTTPQLQKVRDAVGPAYIHIISRTPVAPGTEYAPDLMNLNLTQRVGEQIMRTTIGTVAQQMNLSRDIVTGSVEQTIQFVQSTAPAAEGTGASLTVQSMDGENVDTQKLAAEHFAAFIRRYPKQTTQYVRPMFEAFGLQPQLFAVSDELACAVLPEAFEPDARTREELLGLVNDLKADDFRKRQQADAAIAAMGMRAMPVLVALDGATLAPEQAARVDALLSKLKPPFEISPRQLREDRSFLLDCLLSENKAVRAAAGSRLSALVGKPLNLPDISSVSVGAVYQLRRELLPESSPTSQSTQEPSAPKAATTHPGKE